MQQMLDNIRFLLPFTISDLPQERLETARPPSIAFESTGRILTDWLDITQRKCNHFPSALVFVIIRFSLFILFLDLPLARPSVVPFTKSSYLRQFGDLPTIPGYAP